MNLQAKNTKISETPIDTLTTQGYTIGFLGCATTGTNEITCYMRVVNNQGDRNFRVAANGDYFNNASVIFDDLNNSYNASSLTFTSITNSNLAEVTLIQGVPANISITFKGIDIRAKSIASFKPSFNDRNTNTIFNANFRNVKF